MLFVIRWSNPLVETSFLCIPCPRVGCHDALSLSLSLSPTEVVRLEVNNEVNVIGFIIVVQVKLYDVLKSILLDVLSYTRDLNFSVEFLLKLFHFHL